MRASSADRRRVRHPLALPLAALALALLGLASPAQAGPQVVTVCGSQDAPGGLNFATALAMGGDIVIRCPAGESTITLTRTLDVPGGGRINGEGKVTLRGPVAGPLFTPRISLTLAHLTIANPRTAATAAAAHAGAIVFAPFAQLLLEDVTTQDSFSAYTARTLTVRNSRFVRNGDPSSLVGPGAILDADAIDLHGASFTGNFDHPIAGGTVPQVAREALSRRVFIEDSVFEANRAGLLISDARVLVLRSRFRANGFPPASWAQTWGCCGGAVTLVRSDARFSGSEFDGNSTPGFGGAIYAIGSRIMIRDTVFRANKARVGGAILYWGRAPRTNVWNSTVWNDPPSLDLSRTQFQANRATLAGGALVFAGTVQGNVNLFVGNTSGGAGGAVAVWGAATLPAVFAGVFPALVDASVPGGADRIALGRPILVDNHAQGAGAAIAAGNAALTIGNGLIAHNRSAATGAGTLNGSDVGLFNTAVADNGAGGLVVAGGGKSRLVNTVLLRNGGFNCALPGSPSAVGGSFQYPGTDCMGLAARDPGLDVRYAPSLVSAARGAGDTSTCAGDPLVAGVDVYGQTRLAHGRCDSGAVEQSLSETIASSLGLGTDIRGVTRLIQIVFWLALLFFLIGCLWAMRRRRRRSAA